MDLGARDLVERLVAVGAGRVEVRGAVGSTNTELAEAVRADPEAWPDRSVLVAAHQQAGRGRSGRTWTTPPGVALTASVLLRPDVPAELLGWLPLIGGLAVAAGLRDLGAAAEVKWPNDVLLPAEGELAGWGAYRKVAGVLADVVAGDRVAADQQVRSVVLGFGVNVSQEADQLPVDSATSLLLAGVAVRRDDVLAAVLSHLVAMDEAWQAAGGDATAAGLTEAWRAMSAAPGEVAVELPGGERLVGVVAGLAPDGALLVEAAGQVRAVHAGDVRIRRT
ncbi:biotin--[acetyl-CoA-carboxylase] ligase [Actinotalea sp. M2MS4P-6]|uniref:biotin--[acetyl-CoA-carboxylase] ligase n=1 Tax=Actinotalea sp. M2MS4P-6 TaxID=2983762 RepID=UPI0021E3AB23|nr:biotin--[acetyl-CoA-carboxylase] ligase [Actinotalea sp. M2MS4P-6]MCV2393520.1 biotin--[acetyl-CoA-carboxylase] ligase [Actinotalea sp. M2MS4P-6]